MKSQSLPFFCFLFFVLPLAAWSTEYIISNPEDQSERALLEEFLPGKWVIRAPKAGYEPEPEPEPEPESESESDIYPYSVIPCVEENSVSIIYVQGEEPVELLLLEQCIDMSSHYAES